MHLKQNLYKLKNKILEDTHLPVLESFFLLIDDSGVLTIHGCQQLTKCSEKAIDIVCTGNRIRIEGCELTVESLTETDLRISGLIKEISFFERN